MKRTAELRRQIESALVKRIQTTLGFCSAALPELLPCGIPEIDEALGGGLPLGGISELTGPASSGRTSLALTILTDITQHGSACAYIDVSDAFDPVSASALGINLRRLLWVRAGDAGPAMACSPFSVAPPVEVKKAAEVGRRHSRSESLGLSSAVGELFGIADDSVSESASFTALCSEAIPRQRRQPRLVTSKTESFCPSPTRVQQQASQQKPWARLDRALRATDLLLNAGGFRALILDMADIPPIQARRVPLTTWYRFRFQVEKARMLFLLLTRSACANSCAAITLKCKAARANWQQATEKSSSLLTGLHFCIQVTRNRTVNSYGKKPAASTEARWSSTTLWSR